MTERAPFLSVMPQPLEMTVHCSALGRAAAVAVLERQVLSLVHTPEEESTIKTAAALAGTEPCDCCRFKDSYNRSSWLDDAYDLTGWVPRWAPGSLLVMSHFYSDGPERAWLIRDEVALRARSEMRASKMEEQRRLIGGIGGATGASWSNARTFEVGLLVRAGDEFVLWKAMVRGHSTAWGATMQPVHPLAAHTRSGPLAERMIARTRMRADSLEALRRFHHLIGRNG